MSGYDVDDAAEKAFLRIAGAMGLDACALVKEERRNPNVRAILAALSNILGETFEAGRLSQGELCGGASIQGENGG